MKDMWVVIKFYTLVSREARYQCVCEHVRMYVYYKCYYAYHQWELQQEYLRHSLVIPIPSNPQE